MHVAAGSLQLPLPSDLLPRLRLLLQKTLSYDYRQRPTFAEIKEELRRIQETAIAGIEKDLDEFFCY